MSRVTKAYKNEPRRSTLFSKEKRGVPSQRTSDCCSKDDPVTEGGPPSEGDADLNSNLSDSLSKKFSTMLGTVGEGDSVPKVHKFWNEALGDSNISTSESPSGLFCEAPVDHLQVGSNGRPSLRIVIPTLPIPSRKVDELPNAPVITSDHCKPPWGHRDDLPDS